jgi:hypothetical protein
LLLQGEHVLLGGRFEFGFGAQHHP